MTPSRLRPTARTLFAALAALALALTNVAAGCPGDPPPPIDLPVLATTAAVGSLPGSTAVSDDGTFTYSAPIPVPPGRAGMQPSLSLSYASTPSEGSLGVGFALSGLSSITRCGQSVAIDGQHRGVELDDEDRLCLDGARLLAVEGEDMQAGTNYRTETETWRRIETVESDRVGVTGPVTLRVRMPDGRERLYGASNDSRLEITRADGSRVVATWFLTLERDPRGNAIRYGYDHVTPTLPAELAALADPDPPTYDLVRISRIDYTGTANELGTLTSPGTRSVRFTYASTPRTPDRGVLNADDPAEEPGVEDGFFEGSYGWRASAFPLERIRTFVEEDLVHELRLVGETEPVSRRYRLTSAQLCANAPPAPGTTTDAGLVCMPRTTFAWRALTAPGAPLTDDRYGAPSFEIREVPSHASPLERRPCTLELDGYDWGFCDTPTPAVALDANGDGADDLVYLISASEERAPLLAIRYGGYAPRDSAVLGADTPLQRLQLLNVIPDRADRDLSVLNVSLQYANAVDWNLDGRDDLVLVLADHTTAHLRWELMVAVAATDTRFELQPTGLFIPTSLDDEELQAGDLRGAHAGRSLHGRGRFELADMDGDGRQDVLACLDATDTRDRYFDGRSHVRAAHGNWWVAFRHPDGTLGVPTPSGLRRMHPTVVETECAFEYGGLERETGVPGEVSVDYHYYDFHVMTLDSDGDGRQELLIAPPWFTDYPGLPSRDRNVRLLRWDGFRVVAERTNVPNERFTVFDANGDGLHDLATEHASLVPPVLAGRVPSNPDLVLSLVYLSQGRGQFTVTTPTVAVPDRVRTQRRKWMPGSDETRWIRDPLSIFGFDLNGDSRGDLLFTSISPEEVWPETRWARSTSGAPTARVDSWARAQFHAFETLTSTADVTYETGGYVEGNLALRLRDPSVPELFRTEHIAMDADGDGALDLLTIPRFGRVRGSTSVVPFGRQGALRLLHNVRAQPLLVERIQDGLGAETIARYTPLSDARVYRASRDCAYPTRCTSDSRYVVRSVLYDTGADARLYVEEEHTYQGGRVDLQGRGFLGFSRHVVRNTVTGEVVDRRFNAVYDPATRSYPGAGRPRAVLRYRLDPSVVGEDATRFVGSKELFTYDLRVTDVGTHYVVTTSARTREYEEEAIPPGVALGRDPFLALLPERTVTRDMTYDSFGSLRRSVETIDGVAGRLIRRYVPVHDEARWRIGLPGREVVQTDEQDGACSLDSWTVYSVDTATAEVTAITRTTSTSGDPSIDRTTTFTRDAWGNVLTATSTSAEPTRTVRLTYEPTGYFVDSITNALGHRTAVEIEARFGQIHRAEDPNGVEALRSFDGFGRLREARSTGRGGVEISYDLADPVGRHQVRIDPDEGGHEVVEYDRLGRAVASQVEHAFVTSYAFREFDRLGRLVAESAPFTDPAEASTVARHRYIYDLIGRVTSTTSADGVVTGYEYGVAERRVTPVAADGTNTTTTTELDRAGRVLAVEEPETTEIAEGDTRVVTAPAARTSYQYCRSGALRRTRDPRGHVTTVEYDDLGRRVFLEDPAAGVARFEHNALDEIARTEDALGRVNRWERDVLGRVEALHHEADGIVDRFFYDTAPLGTTGRTVLGALASSESGDGVIDTYEYDSVARTRAQSRLVEGRLLRFENDLDDFGRVLETRYPDTLGLGAIAVSNRYDARSGETTEVWLDGDRVWRLEAQNGFGAATGEHLGSPGGGSPAWGEIDRASVYSADGRMTRLESRAGAIQLQDFQYDYEDRGLLTRRVDGLLGRSDELVYDELRHLRTLGERGAAVRERYSMDEIGNLTATHDGELHYLDPAHPYAATEIDGPNGGSFRYDAVGNAYRARDLEIAYTQRNLPRTIDSDKTGLVRYTYDAGGGRASKRGRDTDITYFGLYELERRGMQLYERLSIDTPVGVVAQVERGAQSGPNGPGSRLRWLLVERQGSVETTWVSGESPQHIQYDAYGGVLTSGGSASGERPGATVSQGYTSHEHEDDVELINMGGRVYSPHLRRFLTADPLVMDPVGQGLNAYLYASGSPSNATDPTGLYVLWSEQVEFDGGPALLLWDQHGNVAACGVDGRGCVSDGEFDWGDGPATERAGAGASGSATATTSGSVEPPWLEQLDTNPAVLGWMNFAAGFGESVTDLLPPVTHMADQRTGVVDVAVRSVLAPVRSYNRGAGLHNGVIDPTSPRYRDGADVAMLWWLALGPAAILSPATVPAAGAGTAVLAAEGEGALHAPSLIHHPDGSIRTPGGQFASPAGAAPPGAVLESEFAQHLAQGGMDVTAEHIAVQTPFGRRLPDMAVRDAGGRLHGIEFKSSPTAHYGPEQFAADRLINRQGATITEGPLAGERLESMTVVRRGL